MRIEEFSLERIQSIYENTVDLNLSDSGVHPFDLKSLLTPEELEELCSIGLGYGWTNGSEELRDAVAGLYNDRTRDNVLITNGSAEANFLMVMALLEPGDELIAVVPNYLQIYGWARALGVVVKTVKLREENAWLPEIGDFAGLVTDRTRMITICNPNNPTGAVLSVAQMEELAALAGEHDLYLHADEVYKGAELEGAEAPSFGDLYAKSIVTNGLSKAMALPGLRLGWLLGPPEEIYQCWHCKDYTSITTGILSEYIAARVLEPSRRHKIMARSKDILRTNLGLLQGWISDNPGFSLVPPRAGGMAFIRYGMDINSTELTHQLRRAKGVFVLPGDVYGLDGYMRIGIGGEREQLMAGLALLSEFVAERNVP